MARSNNYRESKRNFKVYINQGEMDQIKKWVLMKDNIETGGDLFGLWIDQHTAVVQFVLGPGKHCKRTAVSFYQDVNYLEEAGKYLTKQHGLCNIGQWHSHHRLNLRRPSGGDENTVWGNMPNLGLNRYIVFIATIQGGYYNRPTAEVNCFLFETENDRQLPVLEGMCEPYLYGNSPFRLGNEIRSKTKIGAESINKIKYFEEKFKTPKRPRESENEQGKKQRKVQPEVQRSREELGVGEEMESVSNEADKSGGESKEQAQKKDTVPRKFQRSREELGEEMKSVSNEADKSGGESKEQARKKDTVPRKFQRSREELGEEMESVSNEADKSGGGSKEQAQKRDTVPRKFQVFIHEGEMDRIRKWVLMKDNIETGGDLFGLWIDQHTAVVQFVLGPGKDCKRTKASFYQNVNYLEEAGKYLTEQHGLCNIGQWHSHHRMSSLDYPSGGDENTVWGNMPKLGLDRYIVFIATIKEDGKANINCFLFEIEDGRQLPVLRGSFCDSQMKGDSPFRLDKPIMEQIKKGAQSICVADEQRNAKRPCETVGSDKGQSKIPKLGKTTEEAKESFDKSKELPTYYGEMEDEKEIEEEDLKGRTPTINQEIVQMSSNLEQTNAKQCFTSSNEDLQGSKDGDGCHKEGSCTDCTDVMNEGQLNQPEQESASDGQHEQQTTEELRECDKEELAAQEEGPTDDKSGSSADQGELNDTLQELNASIKVCGAVTTSDPADKDMQEDKVSSGYSTQDGKDSLVDLSVEQNENKDSLQEMKNSNVSDAEKAAEPRDKDMQEDKVSSGDSTQDGKDSLADLSAKQNEDNDSLQEMKNSNVSDGEKAAEPRDKDMQEEKVSRGNSTQGGEDSLVDSSVEQDEDNDSAQLEDTAMKSLTDEKEVDDKFTLRDDELPLAGSAVGQDKSDENSQEDASFSKDLTVNETVETTGPDLTGEKNEVNDDVSKYEALFFSSTTGQEKANKGPQDAEPNDTAYLEGNDKANVGDSTKDIEILLELSSSAEQCVSDSNLIELETAKDLTECSTVKATEPANDTAYLKEEEDTNAGDFTKDSEVLLELSSSTEQAISNTKLGTMDDWTVVEATEPKGKDIQVNEQPNDDLTQVGNISPAEQDKIADNECRQEDVAMNDWIVYDAVEAIISESAEVQDNETRTHDSKDGRVSLTTSTKEEKQGSDVPHEDVTMNGSIVCGTIEATTSENAEVQDNETPTHNPTKDGKVLLTNPTKEQEQGSDSPHEDVRMNGSIVCETVKATTPENAEVQDNEKSTHDSTKDGKVLLTSPTKEQEQGSDSPHEDVTMNGSIVSCETVEATTPEGAEVQDTETPTHDSIKDGEVHLTSSTKEQKQGRDVAHEDVTMNGSIVYETVEATTSENAEVQDNETPTHDPTKDGNVLLTSLTKHQKRDSYILAMEDNEGEKKNDSVHSIFDPPPHNSTESEQRRIKQGNELEPTTAKDKCTTQEPTATIPYETEEKPDKQKNLITVEEAATQDEKMAREKSDVIAADEKIIGNSPGGIENISNDKTPKEIQAQSSQLDITRASPANSNEKTSEKEKEEEVPRDPASHKNESLQATVVKDESVHGKESKSKKKKEGNDEKKMEIITVDDGDDGAQNEGEMVQGKDNSKKKKGRKKWYKKKWWGKSKWGKKNKKGKKMKNSTADDGDDGKKGEKSKEEKKIKSITADDGDDGVEDEDEMVQSKDNLKKKRGKKKWYRMKWRKKSKKGKKMKASPADDGDGKDNSKKKKGKKSKKREKIKGSIADDGDGDAQDENEMIFGEDNSSSKKKRAKKSKKKEKIKGSTADDGDDGVQDEGEMVLGKDNSKKKGGKKKKGEKSKEEKKIKCITADDGDDGVENEDEMVRSKDNLKKKRGKKKWYRMKWRKKSKKGKKVKASPADDGDGEDNSKKKKGKKSKKREKIKGSTADDGDDGLQDKGEMALGEDNLKKKKDKKNKKEKKMKTSLANDGDDGVQNEDEMVLGIGKDNSKKKGGKWKKWYKRSKKETKVKSSTTNDGDENIQDEGEMKHGKEKSEKKWFKKSTKAGKKR